MSTSEKILEKLKAYNLKQDGTDQYRSNRPWSDGSDSMGLSIKIDGPEHGTFHDHVSGESGSLFDLAERLGVKFTQPVKPPSKPSGEYIGLKEYAERHGVGSHVFLEAKWEETIYQDRPTLKFSTKTGPRYRFLDGKLPKFKHGQGYRSCWYGLETGIEIAKETGSPLVICNGEPSVVVSQHLNIAACATTGGEKKSLRIDLLQELIGKWSGEIILAPDCDDTGRDMVFGNANQPGLLHQLQMVGYKVRAVNLELGELEDLADFCRLNQENSVTKLYTLPDLKPSTKDRFTIHWASEALLPQPTIDWIITGLIPKGTVTLIVGKPGCKKTWTALDLAVCVANGKDWINFPTDQGNVLIIDEESGIRFLNRRLAATIRGHFAENQPLPIAYTSLECLNLINDVDILHFHRLIERTQANLVIIDAMADIMPGADENAVKDVHPVFMALRKLAEETQAAIVIIHHTNRSGEYRGSSAMEGAVDLMLKIESRQGSPNIDFITKKPRHTEVVRFAAKANWIEDNGLELHFFLEASGPTEKRRTFSKSMGFVLKYLRDNGEQPIPEIMSHAEICSPESARRAVYDLANLGLVERTNKGAMGQGVQAIYALTEEGRVEAGKLI